MVESLSLEHCTIDLGQRQVHGAEIRLTPLEWSLLDYLAQQNERVVERDELLTEVWGYRSGIRTRAVDNAVARLRKKIEVRPETPRHLLSIRGGGYRLVNVQGDGPTLPGPTPKPTLDRQAALHALTDALQSHRVVTLTGPGGAGKTWVAERVTNAIGKQADTKVVHCNLGDATTTQQIEARVAHALKPGPLPVATALVHAHKTLLVLDDAETAIEPLSTLLRTWLDDAPRLRVLITSRRPIGLADERVVPLPPLPIRAAVQLFVERALEAGGRPTIDPDLEALVEGLDCLPQAIELAATLSITMSPTQLLQHLSRRFQLLKQRGRGAPSRHQSLLTVIEGSIDLLEPWQQRALIQCAVFPTDFTAEAADAILDLGEHWPVDALHALIEANLVYSRHAKGAHRLCVYRSVLTWARSQFEDHPDQPEVQRRFIAWYGAMGDGTPFVPLNQAEAATQLKTLSVERDNLRSAFTLARESARPDDIAAIAQALLYIIDMEGPPDAANWIADSALADGVEARDADRILLRRLRIVREQRSPAEVDRLSQELLQRLRARDDEEGVATALTQRGFMLNRQSRWPEARQTLEQAAEAWRRLGNEAGEANTLGRLGVVRRRGGDIDGALSCFQRALNLHESNGNHVRRSATLLEIGHLWGTLGDLPRAREHLERGLSGLVGQSPRHLEVQGRLMLGGLLVNLGQLEAADEHLQVALSIAQDLGDAEMEIGARGYLADLAFQSGNAGEAEQHYLTAEEFHRIHGDRLCEAIACGNRGDLYLATGRYEAARRCLESAIEGLEAVGFDAAQGTFTSALALTLDQLGETERARALADDAHGHLEKQPYRLAVLHCRVGLMEQRAGELDAARDRLETAEALAAPMGLGGRGQLGMALDQLRRALDASPRPPQDEPTR